MNQEEVESEIARFHADFHHGTLVDCQRCIALAKRLGFGERMQGKPRIGESQSNPYEPRSGIGRPPLPMPDPIPDTPENIASALMNTPPMPAHQWDYMKEHEVRKWERRRTQ